MDVDATVTRCRELAEFMRKQGAVTGAEAFEEAAAALLALRERAETAERVRDDTQARFLLRHKDAVARLAEVVDLRNQVATLNAELAAASAEFKEVLRGQEMIGAKMRNLDALCQSLIKEREELREAAKLTLQWFDSERTYVVDFYARMAMCDEAERKLRAALAPAEQPAGKPVCRECGSFLDSRDRCRIEEHNT
jgi:chromosome segregation ATPase